MLSLKRNSIHSQSLMLPIWSGKGILNYTVATGSSSHSQCQRGFWGRKNRATQMHLVISKVRDGICSDTLSISARSGSLASCSNLLAFCQSRLLHVLQVWRWRKGPCSRGKFLLLCFNEGNLQLMLMSFSSLTRISGWAGIPHSQHEVSVIQLCSNIQN